MHSSAEIKEVHEHTHSDTSAHLFMLALPFVDCAVRTHDHCAVQQALRDADQDVPSFTIKLFSLPCVRFRVVCLRALVCTCLRK